MRQNLDQIGRQIGYILQTHGKSIRKAEEQTGEQYADRMVEPEERCGDTRPTASIAHVAGEHCEMPH